MFDQTVSIQNQRPAVTFIAIIVMIATYTVPLSPAFADETKAARIMVTGEGETSLAPDMAIVSLGVTREAETARDALTQNNDAMASVIASMKASGIAAKDLQTSNFSIQPRYFHHSTKNNEQPKPPSIIGYIVTNNLTLRLRDLTILGEIIDKSVSLGVNADGGIRFINEDPGEAITKARISAMKDARNKAETLVEAAGTSLGRLMEITETSNRPVPVAMARGRMMADSAMAQSVPIEGGENTYAVTVSATWEIAQ